MILFVALACVQELEPPGVVGNPDHDFDEDGYSEREGDCDDRRPELNPSATEICDGLDNDCDGLVDDQDVDIDPSQQTSWYLDQDGDGYGDGSRADRRCDASSPAWVELSGDCDDLDEQIHPEAEEVCGDGLDNDCDGSPGACGWGLENQLDEATAVFTGSSPGERAGFAMVCMDLLGEDGAEDLIFSAPRSGGADLQGSLHVFSGAEDFSGSYDFDEAELEILGLHTPGYLGTQLERLPRAGGDLLVVGMPGEYSSSSSGGGVYLLEAVAEGGQLDLAEGFEFAFIEGVGAGDLLGWQVQASPGGLLALGAREWGGEVAASGAVYLLDEIPEGQVLVDDVAVARLEGSQAVEALGHAEFGFLDVDGDGLEDLIVGSHRRENPSGLDTGALYILHGPVSGQVRVEERADLRIYGDSEDDGFGFRVIANEDMDVNGDGVTDLLVAAPYHDGAGEPGSASGRLYTLGLDELALAPEVASVGSISNLRIDGDTEEGAQAGGAMTAPGDFNGDGHLDLTVGTPLEIDEAAVGRVLHLNLPLPEASGAVHMIDYALVFDGAEDTRDAGADLAGGCDLDADGYDELLIGAPNLEHQGSGGAGKVYLIAGRPGL
jgi:hypothetical protein